jgi:Bacterial membrane protein YfhO
MGIKSSETAGRQRGSIWLMLLLIFIILSVLFRYNYLPGFTLASNDGPIGTLKSDSHKLPEEFFGGWQDLNSVGIREGTWPSLTYALLCTLKPILYSKLYAPVGLFLLGLAAFSFFRAMKFTPAACIIGGLAAMLNSGFFSVACWGVVAHTNTIAMTFFAMAALVSARNATSPIQCWVRVALAGLAVGMGVAEGADVGAIFSVYVALFAMFQAWNSEGPVVPKLGMGAVRVGVVALFALFLAAQPISALVATAITGVAGTKQDEKTKQERWIFSTQTSLPKSEALCLLIPGLFGYRMDTPRDMSAFESAYQNGVYWGQAGRDPAWDAAHDEWLKSGKQGQPPNAAHYGMRYTGGGNYTGVLVVMIALWAALQSWQKEKSVFSLAQRRWIWFWIAAAICSLLLAFGRYAPFYWYFYKLPYVSAIRNPSKFTHAVNLTLVVLFGFGLHGLCRKYFETAASATSSFTGHLKNWWSKVSGFDRKWVVGCGIAFATSVIGWFIYASSRQSLESYIQFVGYPAEMAKGIAGLSIGEVGWFVLFLFLAGALVTVALSGWFAGRRAKLGAILMGILLVVDLGRANQPWIIVWDYDQRYQSNPIVDFLKEKPYEHRVASLPQYASQLALAFRAPQADKIAGAEEFFQQVYRIEWAQHILLYYNIQSLDIVQMRSMPEDIKAYLESFQPRPPRAQTQEEFQRFIGELRLPTREWELTNTRYLLGAAPLVELLNGVFDQQKHRFRIVERFDMLAKPGITNPTKVAEETAVPSTNGIFALIEFMGALPRAKLFPNWEVNTNTEATLKQLASPEFDPAKIVLVTEPVAVPSSATATNENAGTVEFASYDPNHIVLKANANAQSILLLNDRYDPNWKVTVDGKPATLLHANYIMRGVQLSPGAHTVDYRFAPPVNLFYVSLAAIIVGIGLLGFLAVTNRREEAEPSAKSSPPVAKK